MQIKADTALTRFMRDTNRYPILNRDREYEIATAWRSRQDRAALDLLIGSHLRLVVKIARGFVGYGLPLSDLVAEGNLGLMRAAQKYDPERGFRFSTYAVWWIRAEIQAYILHSWSIVKIGTTTAQKRLFFNLRRLKAKLEDVGHGDLRPETVATIAANLDVSETDVIEMNRRLGGDSSLNAMSGADVKSEWLELLADLRPCQEAVLSDAEEQRERSRMLGDALMNLHPREREIVVRRRLKERPVTFEELSQRFSVSPERIRQIEAQAIKKLTMSVAWLQKQVRTADLQDDVHHLPNAR